MIIHGAEVVMPIDVIDTEEFAKRMKIPVKDAKRAIRNGGLKPGRHFILIGKSVRFVWGEELLSKLQEDSSVGPTMATEKAPAPVLPASPSKKGMGANRDYFKSRRI
jgi:hypothetical protein